VLRDRITAIMDSLRLDALVYPTMRRKPALVGDPQLGSTCALSAQTGLPALSIPAGFTAEGLPVGVELLGRAFGDVRLVSIGYAFEQLGPRRRAPFSTPPLSNGKAPASIAFSVTAGSTPDRAATARFTYDKVTGTLGYEVAMRGLAPTMVQAVALLRRDGAGRTRVIQRLSGPDALTGSGTATLGPVDRQALSAAQVYLSLVTTDHPPIETQVVIPN